MHLRGFFMSQPFLSISVSALSLSLWATGVVGLFSGSCRTKKNHNAASISCRRSRSVRNASTFLKANACQRLVTLGRCMLFCSVKRERGWCVLTSLSAQEHIYLICDDLLRGLEATVTLLPWHLESTKRLWRVWWEETRVCTQAHVLMDRKGNIQTRAHLIRGDKREIKLPVIWFYENKLSDLGSLHYFGLSGSRPGYPHSSRWQSECLSLQLCVKTHSRSVVAEVVRSLLTILLDSVSK